MSDQAGARKAAAWRRRRVIFNNDGDEAHFTPAPATAKGYLSVRIDHMAGTDVDTLFQYPRRPISPLYQYAAELGAAGTTLQGLAELGTDDLQLAIDWCRQHRVEIVWSMRMNDIHDNFRDKTEIAQWKKDHMDMLLGTPEDKERYPKSDPRHVWTSADYVRQEVRDLMVETFRDALDQYDIDGIEMDFLRHVAYFKETRSVEPATAEHLDMLTEMVGRIREDVLAASERKGKPILLGARVLPTLARNRSYGFDVQRWAEEGNIDFLTLSGGYDPFTVDVKDLIVRGHGWGMPVYVCLSTSGFAHAGEGVPYSDVENTLECWRAAAANAWHAGADGIVTFNLFPMFPRTMDTTIAQQIWREIGDPEGMAHKNKVYCIENLSSLHENGIFQSVPIEGRLPVEIERGSSVHRNLPVADDLTAAEDHLQSVRLRVCLPRRSKDRVAVSINGEPLVVAPERPHWMAAEVPAHAMRRGDNDLTVAFVAGESGALTLESAELEVRYGEPDVSGPRL